MTTTSAYPSQDVRSQLLRFRLDLQKMEDFRHGGYRSSRTGELGSLVAAVEGVEATIVTATLIELFQPGALPESLVVADGAATEWKVVRVSKASPLEVLLQLPVAAGSLAAGAFSLAWGVIRLHNAYQEARVTRAKSDAEVAFYRHVESELIRAAPRKQGRQDQDSAPFLNKTDYLALRNLTDRAAKTFEAAETIEAPEA